MAFSALEKRHRVQYGLNLKTGKKPLAIPRRVCDTPAERAEYGHSHIAPFLTHLSWYYDGFTPQTFRKCLQAWLRRGPVAREVLYKTWFWLAREGAAFQDVESETGENHVLFSDAHETCLEQEGRKIDRRKIDSVDKLDLQNEEQFEFRYQVFRYNFEAINFFLRSSVLPVETKQYLHKTVANASNLIESTGDTVGFSDTKDNSLVLPPAVQQHLLPHLCGTDDQLIACVKKNNAYH